MFQPIGSVLVQDVFEISYSMEAVGKNLFCIRASSTKCKAPYSAHTACIFASSAERARHIADFLCSNGVFPENLKEVLHDLGILQVPNSPQAIVS